MFGHIIGSIPEMEGVSTSVEKYIPFIIMLLLKLFIDHGAGKLSKQSVTLLPPCVENVRFERMRLCFSDKF